MHLGIQLVYMIQSGNSLKAWGHCVKVGRNSVPLQPRRICLRASKYFIPRGNILHSCLCVSWHFPNNAVVLVHGIARAAAQGLWNLLGQLRHLEGGRKALDNLQMTLSKLRQPTPELAAAGALGLLPVHQKLQNCSLHVWFLDVIVDVAQRVVYVA